MRARGLALLFGLILVAPQIAPAADGDFYRWTVRGYGARLKNSADDEQRNTTFHGAFGHTKAGLDSWGSGYGLGLEYRATRLLGIDFNALFADFDSRFMLDLIADWQSDTDSLSVDPMTLGLNFHLTPDSRVDFFLGPMIGRVNYGNLAFTTYGETMRFNVDDDSFAAGANLGLDIPFTRSGPLAATVGLRYLDTKAKSSGFNFDVSPLIGLVGLAVRFGPTAGGGEEMAPEAPAPAPMAAPAPAAPAPMAPPTAEEERGMETPPERMEAPPSGMAAPPAAAPPAAAVPPGAAAPPAAAAPPTGGPTAPVAPPATQPAETETVNFGPGSARVSNIGKAKLDEVALKMKQDADLTARVIGYADSSGSEEVNQRLSEQRAQAVKDYLVQRHGIDPSRITVEGRGSQEPVASNETAAGRRQNRRAVIILQSE